VRSSTPKKTSRLLREKAKLRIEDPVWRRRMSRSISKSWKCPRIRRRRTRAISKAQLQRYRDDPKARSRISRLRKGKTMEQIHGPNWRRVYRRRYGYWPEDRKPDASIRGQWAYQGRLWAELVKSRDDFKCQEEGCGSRINVEAHHILPWSKHPELRFEISNGVTLCFRHHCKRHQHRKVDAADKRSRTPVPLGGDITKGF